MAAVADDYRISWGSAYGVPICRADTQFLIDSLGQLVGFNPTIRRALQAEIEFRRRFGRAAKSRPEREEKLAGWEPAAAPVAAQGIDPVRLASALAAWKAQVALREHPDRGGSEERFTAAMRAVDDWAAILKAMGVPV